MYTFGIDAAIMNLTNCTFKPLLVQHINGDTVEGGADCIMVCYQHMQLKT